MKTIKLSPRTVKPENGCGGKKRGCHFPVIYLPVMKKVA